MRAKWGGQKWLILGEKLIQGTKNKQGAYSKKWKRDKIRSKMCLRESA